jgi:splicing factor 3B subunit 3
MYFSIQETSIELLAIDEDANLQSILDQPVFGFIRDLAVLACNHKFRPNHPNVCCLFLSATIISF